MQVFSSVTMSRESISRMDRLFRFLKPEMVGGSFDRFVFLWTFALDIGFGGGGGWDEVVGAT